MLFIFWSMEIYIHFFFQSQIFIFVLFSQPKVKEAADFWQSTLQVRGTHHPIKLRRKCKGNRVKVTPTATYCQLGCQPVTQCGDVVIPEEHLDVSHWSSENFCFTYITFLSLFFTFCF